MVCRCKTQEEHEARYIASMNMSAQQEKEYKQKKIDALKKQLDALTPDPTKWEMVDFVDNGNYLITKVKFDACEHAGYGGHKVLVFKATVKEAMLWRRMDPHFKEAPAQDFAKNEAPVPIARFPASDEGWEDAKAFVNSRINKDKAKEDGIRGPKSIYGVFDPERGC